MDERKYSIRELALITGRSKSGLSRRARRECWAGVIGKGRGGPHFEYIKSSLPEDIRNEIDQHNLKDFWAEQRKASREARDRAYQAFREWEHRMKRFPILLGIANFVMALLSLGLLCMILNRIGR